MARFLVDAQLPPLLAEHLKRSGHQAEHVGDYNTLNRALWQKLEPLLAGIVAAFEAGEIVVEVR